jgi:hypothetical protein
MLPELGDLLVQRRRPRAQLAHAAIVPGRRAARPLAAASANVISVVSPSDLTEVLAMPGKDHGSSVKNPKQYEGLREKGMPKQRAAAISNANAKNDNASSRKGGKNSHK